MIIPGTVTYEPEAAKTVDLAPSEEPSTPPAEAPITNPADWFVPPFPEHLDGLDIHTGFLADLTLKIVSLESDCTTASISERLCLGIIITEALLQRLHREKFIEIKGLIGLHNHRYGMLDRGWLEVRRLMETCSYIGPAPVSLKAYSDHIIQQVRTRPAVKQHVLEQSLASLVLPPDAKLVLGLVASSGRSLFLSGPSGNGKTAAARALVNAIPGEIWIPYAIEVDGQVIRVFDFHNHQPSEHANTDHDRRWVRIRPPLVVVGGELTMQSMDLTNTDTQRFYEAPFQLKSNGGVLLVDDLGRQRCSHRDLLNRWIIPLENRIDYLTLATGKKIQVPFEQIVIFATNLTESDLADEAFMRRMGYRLRIDPPSPNIYGQIFNRYARSRGLSVSPTIIESLLQRYAAERRSPKGCEPRDLIDRAIDVCRYQRRAQKLDEQALDSAWKSYFGRITGPDKD